MLTLIFCFFFLIYFVQLLHKELKVKNNMLIPIHSQKSIWLTQFYVMCLSLSLALFIRLNKSPNWMTNGNSFLFCFLLGFLMGHVCSGFLVEIFLQFLPLDFVFSYYCCCFALVLCLVTLSLTMPKLQQSNSNTNCFAADWTI